MIRIFLALAILGGTGAARAAQPATAPAAQLASPAVLDAEKAYRAALAQSAKERDDKIFTAWREGDQRLEAAMTEAMKQGDLEDTNRIKAMRAVLKVEYTGTPTSATKPSKPQDPKSTAALGARVEMARNVVKAHAEYTQAVDRHGRAHLETLDAAIKAALKAGDLEEANRIAVLKKKVIVTPAAPPGRFPPGALVAFSMDRDSFFKKDGKEFVRDLSGNENHGIATEATSGAGRVGQAVSFHGPGSHLATLKPVGIKDDQPRTLAFWVKFGHVPGGKFRHFAGWGEGQAARKQFRVSLHEGKYLLWSYGAGHDWFINRPVEPKVWHHHAIVYDGRTASWYIDGEALSLTFPITYLTADSPLTVGNCDCAMDEVVVYNRALTAKEIQQLYTRPEK